MGCRPWLAGGFPGRSILVPVSPDGHRDGLGADQRRGARVAALAPRSADWLATSPPSTIQSSCMAATTAGRARPSSGIRCWPRWCAPAWEPGLRWRSTRLWSPWERPPRPPWTSWHVRDSWTVDGACSAFLILPEPTGIGSVCTPSGVPIWHALSSCGAPDRSAEFSRRDRSGGDDGTRTHDPLLAKQVL